jgi:regulator of replication initiation timing
METNQNGAGRKKLYISVIVSLLIVNSVSLYFLFSENHEKTDVIIEKTALQNNFKSLSDSLDAKNTVIDQYIGKDAALDKAIAEKEDMLTQEKHEIAGLLHKNKMTGAELAKAKGLMVEYQASISDLQAKVDALMAENQQLKGQNQQLAADLSTEKQTTTQLSVKNEGLSKKVEVGSLLSVADLSVEAIKTRNNGKEVQVKKAKAAQQFKISFETGENKVIDPGQLSLYVRIINPKGETIAVADQGSGTMQCENSDQPCQFTKKADIDYNQTNKKVVLYWGQDIKDPGTYKIELYQNGHVIGQSAVTLS